MCFFALVQGSLDTDLSEDASPHIDQWPVDSNKGEGDDRQRGSKPKDSQSENWTPEPGVEKCHDAIEDCPKDEQGSPNDYSKRMIDDQFDPLVCDSKAVVHGLHQHRLLMLMKASLEFQLQGWKFCISAKHTKSLHLHLDILLEHLLEFYH